MGFNITFVLVLIFVEDVPEEPVEKDKAVEVEKGQLQKDKSSRNALCVRAIFFERNRITAACVCQKLM
jgi:hypothetical protein